MVTIKRTLEKEEKDRVWENNKEVVDQNSTEPPKDEDKNKNSNNNIDITDKGGEPSRGSYQERDTTERINRDLELAGSQSRWTVFSYS